jgi:hypothetical protein
VTEEDRNNRRFVRVEEMGLAEQTLVRDWLIGYAKQILVPRQIFTNKDGSTGRLYLVCSDLTCNLRTQSNHVFLAICAAFKLECLSLKNQLNPCALCRKQLINTSRSAYDQLLLLRDAT